MFFKFSRRNAGIFLCKARLVVRYPVIWSCMFFPVWYIHQCVAPPDLLRSIFFMTRKPRTMARRVGCFERGINFFFLGKKQQG